MAHVKLQWSATASGAEWRGRTCQHCATEFAFCVKTSASFTSDTSPDRAREEAERALARELAKLVVPTSCPQCGGVPADMLPEARRLALGRYYGVVVWGAILAIGIAALIGDLGDRNEIRLSFWGLVLGPPSNVWAAIRHGWLLAVLVGAVVAWNGVNLASRRVSERSAAKSLPVGLTRHAFDAQRAADPSVPSWIELVRRPATNGKGES